MADAAEAKAKKKLPMTLIAVVGMSLLQAGGFVVAFKMMSGAAPGPSYGKDGKHAIDAGDGHDAHAKPADDHGDAHAKPAEDHGAAHGGHDDGHGKADDHGKADAAHDPAMSKPPRSHAELMLLKSFRVPNNKGGRTYIFDFDLSVVVPEKRRAEVEMLIKDRAGEIADAAARVIRSADARVLNEDDFRVLRKQLADALEKVLGDGSVERVLIPRCVPLRLD